MLKNAFSNSKELSLSQAKMNDLNGHDAERFSASSLTMALNARISWASRKEDNAKTDLIITMLHPWVENKAEVILTQIKSGKTYGKVSPSKKYIFKLEKSQFKVFLKLNHHTLICWVDREKSEIYWLVIKANAKFYRNVYGLSHKLSPATRFDLIRVLNGFGDRNGGKGLQFTAMYPDKTQASNKYDYTTFKKLRATAKSKYNQLKRVKIISNIFGEIQVTNYGWRHMTRESRWNTFKVATYEIIPILNHILSKSPSKHFIQNYWEEEDENSVYRKIEFLLEYHEVKILSSKDSTLYPIEVYVKLVEFVNYPKDWLKNARLSQSTTRRVVFKSVYYKNKKSS